MGTTAATNALLERRGEPTVLAITRGVRRCLENWLSKPPGNICAPDFYFLNNFTGPVLEVAGENRCKRFRTVSYVWTQTLLEKELRSFYEGGLPLNRDLLHARLSLGRSMNSLAGALAKQIGFNQSLCPMRSAPCRNWVSRGDTAVVDAYLSPDSAANHLEGLRAGFRQSEPRPHDA